MEEWENWLRYLLSKNADFEFYGTDIDDKHVELIRIHKALNEPVAFQKIDYIRSGSYTKKLHEFPVFRAQLWDKLRHAQFEDVCVKIDQRYEDIIRLLQVDAYFTLLKIPQPAEKDAVVHYLNEDEIIQKQDNGLYSITNLGALLFAKDLNEFARLGRKAMRVVQYKGINRLLIQKEESFTPVRDKKHHNKRGQKVGSLMEILYLCICKSINYKNNHYDYRLQSYRIVLYYR